MNQETKLKRLDETLRKYTAKILDHLVKEQDFSNDESIYEKNTAFLNKLLESQKS